MRTLGLLASALCCALFALSCTDSDADERKDVELCEPGSTRTCPCPEAGKAKQRCNDEGTAYGACTCPDAGTTSDLPEDYLRDDQSRAVKGVVCSVGLPRLCEFETEKCCVRSLLTDTCVAYDAVCDCGGEVTDSGLADCVAMEATCDGPEDCSDGTVCCGTYVLDLAGQGARYTSITCTDTCEFAANQRVVCHAGVDECEDGLVCSSSQVLSNFQVCSTPLPPRPDAGAR